MAIPHNLRKGAIIRLEGKAYLVLEYRESRTGQRRPTLHVKIRDVLQGKVLEKSIDDGVPVDVVDSQTRVLQYLYSDPATCHFMDVRTYDQLDIPHEVVGDGAVFLLEETEYKVLFLEDQPVLVELPPTVVLDVVDTPPSAGTASGNTSKAARLKNGIEVQVPRFVKTGDRIRISTDTREYLG
ncbi:MAG TPA: elongation factor P, partial [Planctomycetota bacterium]|nr:elongation factor P [Planctomycetota bacterium]